MDSAFSTALRKMALTGPSPASWFPIPTVSRDQPSVWPPDSGDGTKC